MQQFRVEASNRTDRLVAAEAARDQLQLQLEKIAGSGVDVSKFAVSSSEVGTLEDNLKKIHALEAKLKKRKNDIKELKKMLEYQITRAPQALGMMEEGDLPKDDEEDDENKGDDREQV